VTPVSRSFLLAGLLSLTLAGPALAAPDLEFGVALQPRDPAALDAFVRAVSDPASPQFGQYLRGNDFGERFGPTYQTVEMVSDELRAAGLAPGELPDNSLVLPVHGTAAEVRAAFGPELIESDTAPDPHGRPIRASAAAAATPAAAPELPARVTDEILSVLEHGPADPPVRRALRTPKATGRRDPDVRSRLAPPMPCADAITTAAPSPGFSGAWTYDKLATAYDFTRVRASAGWGARVTVGVMEWEPYLASDIQVFQDCYGTAVPIENVNVGTAPAPGPGSGEAVLDIQTVVALAPAVHLLVYQTGNVSQNAMFAQIAADNRADVISTSWGGCESNTASSSLALGTTVLQQLAAQGQTMMAAAGDDGSEDCGGSHDHLAIDDPGSQPYVLSVGGTAMSDIGDPPLQRPFEIVWNDDSGASGGGGGVSVVHQMPWWQAGPGVINGKSSGVPCNAPLGSYCREAPDVSALADDDEGYVNYYTGAGTPYWSVSGGTSAASPLWAALTASIMSTANCAGQRFGLLGPRLYPLAAAGGSAAFNDITIGTNDISGLFPGYYDAGPGFDMATGLGTPVGGGLVRGLCPTVFTPTGGGAATAPEPGPAAPAPAPDPTTPIATASTPPPVPTAPVEPAPRAGLVSDTPPASRDGRLALGVRCPAGQDCRVDVRVRGQGLDLRLRNRRVAAGESRALPLRLPPRLRGRDRVTLTVTVTTRTAAGQTTTSTQRITVRAHGRGKG
jgi:hypothetical protein